MAELEPTNVLLDKINRIDKIEAQQAENVKSIDRIVKDVDILQKSQKISEFDGRLTKVEKRQEIVMEELKEVHLDVRKMNDTCDKQRATCLAHVAPLSFVADLKNDLKRMEERIQTAYDTTRRETREALDASGKWTRWAFVLSMVACIVSAVSVLLTANVIIHIVK